jgi:very-short-patch-repair endonuclease
MRPQLNARRRTLKRERARQLRSSATDAERSLWSLLRKKQMAHLRFRRQQAIGPYIVDFYRSAAKLVVELDGDQHGEDRHLRYDEARTRWLGANDYRVLRFANTDFLRNPQRVLDGIWHAIRESGVPLPEPLRGSTLPQGEGRA